MTEVRDGRRTAEGVGSGVRGLLLGRLRDVRFVRQGADRGGSVAVAGVLGARGRRRAGPGAGDAGTAPARRGPGRTAPLADPAPVRRGGCGGLSVLLLRGGLAA